MAQKSNIACRTITVDPEPFAEIDVSLVEQALTNLIVNAIQSMP
jgi:signal transduction histidine kinase